MNKRKGRREEGREEKEQGKEEKRSGKREEKTRRGIGRRREAKKNERRSGTKKRANFSSCSPAVEAFVVVAGFSGPSDNPIPIFFFAGGGDFTSLAPFAGAEGFTSLLLAGLVGVAEETRVSSAAEEDVEAIRRGEGRGGVVGEAEAAPLLSATAAVLLSVAMTFT